MSETKMSRPPRRRPGGGPPGAPVEKAKDFKGSMKKMLSYVRRYTFAIVAVMLFAAASTVFNIVSPKILGMATTELFAGFAAKVSGNGGINFAKIGQILLLTLLLYVFSSLMAFAQGWIMTTVSQKMTYRFREEISRKIHRMPMKYFESKTVGEVLSRITNDVDTLGMSLNQSITTLITSVTTLIGVLIMMLSISPLMTLIALVMLPVSGIMMGVVIGKSQKHFVDHQKYLGDINGQIEEVYSGHNIVKAFNKEDDVLAEFDETNEKLYVSGWK